VTTVAETEFYTIKELSAHLGVPEATLRYWRHQGKGPQAYKLGRELRYDKVDVAQWLADRKAGKA
jgi:excisionase family DNA binding protein